MKSNCFVRVSMFIKTLLVTFIIGTACSSYAVEYSSIDAAKSKITFTSKLKEQIANLNGVGDLETLAKSVDQIPALIEGHKAAYEARSGHAVFTRDATRGVLPDLPLGCAILVGPRIGVTPYRFGVGLISGDGRID